jgi:hypothetical protein
VINPIVVAVLQEQEQQVALQTQELEILQFVLDVVEALTQELLQTLVIRD